MTLRRTIVAAAVLAIAFSACGGPSTSKGPASPGASSHALPSFGPAGSSLEALAERDERIWAEAIQDSGAAKILGPKVEAWLDDQRHAYVAAVLAKGGVEAEVRVASTDPWAGIGAQTALGGAGLSLVLAGSFLREFTKSYDPDTNGPNQDFSLPDSETHETTIEGHRATVNLTSAIDFHFAGSKVDGTVDFTITTTIFDASGNIIGTVVVETKATVEMEVCPDIDGGLQAHFSTDTTVTITGAGPGGAGKYHLASSGVATGQVGEDAFLHGMRVTGDASEQVSGSGARSVDAAVTADATVALGKAGDVGSMTFDPANIREDVTRGEDTATGDDITRLDTEVLGTGVIVAGLIFEAAQAKWRNGYCVRIEATESTRDVDPSEVVPFSAKVFHKFDGSELDKKIVARFNGVASASPLDTPQDPPASITFTAGRNVNDLGIVTLKSTSNRGIGTLDLTFTVASPFVLQFEIDSTITATKLSGFSGGGVAKVTGEILLKKGEDGHWRGDGELSPTTTPGRGGCNTATVASNGRVAQAYDWMIRDVVAGPSMTTIELSMDSGVTVENPDTATLKLCPGGSSTNPINTWENLFFISHFHDYKAMGMHVVDWTLVGAPDVWDTGGLLAEATWTENCDDKVHAAPGAGDANDCTGTTQMRLRLVPKPSP